MFCCAAALCRRLCVCVFVAVRYFYLFIFRRGYCSAAFCRIIFLFCKCVCVCVCVCVLHRVAFKDSFAALKGIPRVEFKDSVAASVFMFQQRYVCRMGWKHNFLRSVLRAAMLSAEYAMTK